MSTGDRALIKPIKPMNNHARYGGPADLFGVYIHSGFAVSGPLPPRRPQTWRVRVLLRVAEWFSGVAARIYRHLGDY